MEISVIVWLLILTVGVAVLGIAIVYGTSRNRSRTALEKRVTEAATRREYQAEDKDHT